MLKQPEIFGTEPVGPHEGKLNGDFSPQSSAFVDKETKSAIAEALMKFTQNNPDTVDAG